jgi:hypothetical protein
MKPSGRSHDHGKLARRPEGTAGLWKPARRRGALILLRPAGRHVLRRDRAARRAFVSPQPWLVAERPYRQDQVHWRAAAWALERFQLVWHLPPLELGHHLGFNALDTAAFNDARGFRRVPHLEGRALSELSATAKAPKIDSVTTPMTKPRSEDAGALP